MGDAVSVVVGDIVRALAERFPVERAEEWDRVGLLVGDPARDVTGVAVALDPTLGAIRAAEKAGANVLVTHHPAFLEPPERLTAGPGAGGVAFVAAAAGIALVNAHTNLDRDGEAQSLIPNALGLKPLRPIEARLQPSALVTAYVPSDALDAVRSAAFSAGGGRIGDYRECSYAVAGTGTFTVPEGAHPAVGAVGQSASASEVRLEVVCPLGATESVVAAIVAAHPYEEPLVTVAEVALARNAAAIGMLSEAVGGSMTLGELARAAAERYGVTPRVWGDESARVSLVASATGSAGSLIGAAKRTGAHVLVAGEVRYHDALDATENDLAIVELGHDVSEWPLVALIERTVAGIPGIDPGSILALPARAGWWTT